MDTVCNRWLLCLVSAAQLSSYLAGELALYDVITTTTHDVYFIDMDNNIEYRHITKMKPTEIPDNYLPGKNSFFDKKYTGVTP
jgi:hypothetical protein